MRGRGFRIFVTFAVLCGAALPAGRAHADGVMGQTDRQRVSLSPCRVPGVEGEARCGTYEVFEDREARRGRRIPLKVVVLPALGPAAAAGALFVLAGGPGQAATENADFYARIFAGVRRERDVVLVDQRGTGGSNPLTCDLYGPGARGLLGDLLPPAAVRACRAGWERRADLRLYTTPLAVGDLDEVRAALGHERIDIFGTSYGTRVELRDAQRALDLLFADCAADEACRAAFPDLGQKFRAVMERLERGPIEVEVTDEAAGRGERVAFSRGAAATTVRTLLQSVGGAAQLPLLIHRAAAGDFAPLARVAVSARRAFTKGVSVGVFLSVPNAEDLPFADATAVARASEGTFLGDHYYRQLARACEGLPRGAVPADFREPLRSEVPALLISGFLDPATPPAGAEAVARHLPNSLHVVVRHASHAYGGLSPCLDDLMARFISGGTVKGLDTSCVNQIRRPPFVTSTDGRT